MFDALLKIIRTWIRCHVMERQGTGLCTKPCPTPLIVTARWYLHQRDLGGALNLPAGLKEEGRRAVQ